MSNFTTSAHTHTHTYSYQADQDEEENDEARQADDSLLKHTSPLFLTLQRLDAEEDFLGIELAVSSVVKLTKLFLHFFRKIFEGNSARFRCPQITKSRRVPSGSQGEIRNVMSLFVKCDSKESSVFGRVSRLRAGMSTFADVEIKHLFEHK